MICEVAMLATATIFPRALLQFMTGSMQWWGLLSARIRVKKNMSHLYNQTKKHVFFFSCHSSPYSATSETNTVA